MCDFVIKIWNVIVDDKEFFVVGFVIYWSSVGSYEVFICCCIYGDIYDEEVVESILKKNDGIELWVF